MGHQTAAVAAAGFANMIVAVRLAAVAARVGSAVAREVEVFPADLEGRRNC